MKTGEYGENLAAEWYQKAGFAILQRNYRTKFGEIDIIVYQHNNWLVFVEVKTRSEKTFARPCEWVTVAKQKKIIAAAQEYLLQNQSFKEKIRFDVVEVMLNSKGQPQISCIENAFEV